MKDIRPKEGPTGTGSGPEVHDRQHYKLSGWRNGVCGYRRFFSVTTLAGLRQEENGYQIDDGYTNTPSRGGGSSISPNPEIVQSMDIRTNDFDAQKGRNAGSTVDVYTVS